MLGLEKWRIQNSFHMMFMLVMNIGFSYKYPLLAISNNQILCTNFWLHIALVMKTGLTLYET